MRSVVFLLMFAVCLLAWECAADTPLLPEGQGKGKQQPDGTGITTTTAQQVPLPEPVSEQLPEQLPAPLPEPVPEEVPKEVEVSPEEPQTLGSSKGPEGPEIKTMTAAPPEPKLQPKNPHAGHQDNQEEHLQQQQQQQQQQHSRNSEADSSQIGVQTEMRTGDVSQLALDTPPLSKGKHTIQNAQDNAPNTPENQPQSPTDRQASQSPTSGRNVNAQTPTTTIIRHAASHPPDQDQHHTRQQSQTSPAGNSPVPSKKPPPTSPPAADKAVHQTATSKGDIETHTEETSVSSTSEPEKGESTPPATNSEKLSKAIKSLDNKDTSIGSSLLFALTTLSTLVVMVFAPAY